MNTDDEQLVKRADAKKAEGNFYALLRERAVINPDSTWKEVSRVIFPLMKWAYRI